MSQKNIIILDFDGTITDAEAEGRPYKEGYLEDIALIIDKDIQEIQQQAIEIEKAIHEDAQNFGWIYKVCMPILIQHESHESLGCANSPVCNTLP